MSTSRINDLLNLSHVTHWHTVHTVHKRSVAEHSYRVAVIALEIARRVNKGTTPSSVVVEHHIMQWALYHDGPETETGDLPHTAKVVLGHDAWDKVEKFLCPWYQPEALRIHPIEKLIVKIADELENILYINAEGVGIEASDAGMKMRESLGSYIKIAGEKFGLADVSAIVSDIWSHAEDPSDTRHAKLYSGLESNA